MELSRRFHKRLPILKILVHRVLDQLLADILQLIIQTKDKFFILRTASHLISYSSQTLLCSF